MLGENIRQLRRRKGMSQEELAIRLHVVRQTVSKWENNLSVPDAELLQRMAELFDVKADALLGTELRPEPDRNELAEQLARINEQLVIRNRRGRRLWKAVAAVLGAGLLLWLLLIALMTADYSSGTSVSVAMSSDDPIYSAEEVDEAIEEVQRVFRQEFSGCTLKSISYDEAFSSAESRRRADQYAGEEVIVLKTDFKTGRRGGDGSLAANMTYKNWMWILSREPGASWEVRDWGY